MAGERVAQWSEQDRRDLFEQTAARRGLTAVIVEKDYRVCWTLGLLFMESAHDVSSACRMPVMPGSMVHCDPSFSPTRNPRLASGWCASSRTRMI